MSNSKNYLSDLDRGLSYPNLLLIYFFAILGQTLIYGGVWGVNEIINLQANLSTKGLRVSISPTKRLKLLLINMGCAFVIHFSEVLIFLLFINYVLGVSFGANAFNILLLCVIGSFAGISFGAFIGISLKKASEMVKYGITQIVGVFGAFLSGMMYANMKYWVNTNAPILGYINPVNIIADGLYSLYYFPNKERYTFNMIILVVMCIIFVAGIYANFRRDNYESV